MNEYGYAPSSAEHKAALLEPRRPEPPRTIFIPAVPGSSHATAQIALIDAIAAVQSAGYLVYEMGELPEVTEVFGRPKLPAHFGEVRDGIDQRTAYYEEAFGKLALARWWERQEERIAKRIEALSEDLAATGVAYVDSDRMADHLVRSGWRRG